MACNPLSLCSSQAVLGHRINWPRTTWFLLARGTEDKLLHLAVSIEASLWDLSRMWSLSGQQGYQVDVLRRKQIEMC